MRAVLDTNVLISGVFFGGLPGRILSAWAAGRFDLVLAPDILEEYRRVGEDLARDRRDLVASLEATLALITTHALLVAAPGLPDRACRTGFVGTRTMTSSSRSRWRRAPS